MSYKINWNIEDYEQESSDYEDIPPGEYIGKIEKIEIKKTKSAIQNGTDDCYANIKLKVTSGKFNGRVQFDMANIINSNETAQNIGRSRINQIAYSCNSMEKLKISKDLSCLIDEPLCFVISKEKPKDAYSSSMRSIVTRYKHVSKANQEKESLKVEFIDDDLPF